MKKRIGLAVGVLLLTACTPQEISGWVAWHDQDPAAAEAFANTPEVQASLHPPRQVVFEARSTAWSVNWDKVARCESGGQWSHRQVHNRYGTFSGGLMIMNSAWRKFGGQAFAPYAGAASKAEQIIVAERIAARVGFDRAWQCTAG